MRCFVIRLAAFLSALAPAAAWALDPSAVAEILRAEIEKRGAIELFRVELGALPPSLAAEAGVAHLAELALDDRSGRFAASFSHGGARSTVAGKVVALVQTPALARSFQRGERIEADDIVMIEMPAARIGAWTAVEIDQIVGAEAKRSLRAGEPLRAADLRAPVLVKKGGQVVLSYASGSMRLTLTGRALSDGGMGDTVRVLNIQSSRTVEATIDGKDSAIVRGPTAIAAK